METTLTMFYATNINISEGIEKKFISKALS